MFLIEFEEGKYIDGEKLDYIGLSGSRIQFTLSGDTETLYKVNNGLAGTFVNDLQAIDNNRSGLEAKLRELREAN